MKEIGGGEVRASGPDVALTSRTLKRSPKFITPGWTNSMGEDHRRYASIHNYLNLEGHLMRAKPSMITTQPPWPNSVSSRHDICRL
jgi:hypothetical protein